MKRKAILIGNTRGLKGTRQDMRSMASHLLSYQGGGWLPNEFEILIDVPASELMARIDAVRKENNDFTIVYFTGHGLLQGNTIAEINPQHELIDEDVLFNLAERQINILDCCRGVITSPLPIFRSRRGATAISNQELDKVRKQYEDLVMNNSAPQFVRMYSCDANESSYCLPDGSCSYFSKHLIESISDILKTKDVARTYECHQEAACRTTNSVQNDINRPQHPVIIPAKCAAVAELPLGFNPVLTN